jgi:hypothetical protein
MEQLQSAVCFLLEVTLASLNDNEKLSDLLNQAIQARSPVKFGKLFRTPLTTILKLVGERQLDAMANGRFIPIRDEQSAVFARHWYSTYGILRERTYKEQDKIIRPDPWFGELEALPLPDGLNNQPTPVSGTWYLSIIKGSVATRTGAEIVEQLASTASELDRINQFVGLPVRSCFFVPAMKAKQQTAWQFPYAEQFRKMSKIQYETPYEDYEEKVLKQEYPFHRTQIDGYNDIAPVLWRMMVHAAQVWRRSKEPDFTEVFGEAWALCKELAPHKS